jgi:transcription antitermination factor NusA-like protein
VAEALAEAIQRHVKVICRNDEVHVAVNELLRPVRALGINEIYAVGGKRAHKVRVAKKDAGHLPASREALAAVLDFLFSGNVQLSLE